MILTIACRTMTRVLLSLPLLLLLELLDPDVVSDEGDYNDNDNNDKDYLDDDERG